MGCSQRGVPKFRHPMQVPRYASDDSRVSKSEVAPVTFNTTVWLLLPGRWVVPVQWMNISIATGFGYQPHFSGLHPLAFGVEA